MKNIWTRFPFGVEKTIILRETVPSLDLDLLYCGKNYFNYHEAPPVKRVHFDVEFPCFGVIMV